MKNRKKMITDMLFNKYGSLDLSRGETATVLGISSSTLDRLKKEGTGPVWSKKGNTHNARVVYAIDHIANYMVQQVTNHTV